MTSDPLDSAGVDPSEFRSDSLEEAESLDDLVEIVEPEAPVPEISCARCRKSYPENADHCPFCLARTPGRVDGDREDRRRLHLSFRAMKVLIVSFAVFLFTSVAFGLLLSPQAGQVPDEIRQLTTISVIEAIDSIVVVVAWALLRKLPTPVDEQRNAWSWLFAWPALALLLGINFGYHAVLNWMGIPIIRLSIDWTDSSLVTWKIIIVCLQPAIIEELYFRGVAWKVLRQSQGPHVTIAIVSVMFGMAHIGVPLSIPMLTLIGFALGYTRLYSGGLVLPMLMHFVHNFVVIVVDSQQ